LLSLKHIHLELPQTPPLVGIWGFKLLRMALHLVWRNSKVVLLTYCLKQVVLSIYTAFSDFVLWLDSASACRSTDLVVGSADPFCFSKRMGTLGDVIHLAWTAWL